MKARASAASLAALFDHGVRVWRAPEGVTGGVRANARDYAVVLEAPDAGSFNATLNVPRMPLANEGPGLAPVGIRRLYMAVGADVRPRDIVELVAGPDAPQTLEVDAEPYRPRDHHLEIDCRLWHGKLPAAGS